MNGEVQLIVEAGEAVTYTTGAFPNGFAPRIQNDGTFAPLLSNNILNAFVAQVLNGGDATINAYDSSNVLIATYHLDSASTTVGPITGQYDFWLTDPIGSPDPNITYITFTINTTTQIYLDLFENESISQNWKFQDLNNFTAQGSFSREFRVPFSATNQFALGALFDVNVESGATNYFHYKLPAELRVDTLPIATGYLRVRKVYKQLGRVNEVELAFYAETPDLVRNIGEKKLADVAELTTLNETINYANVTNANANRIWTILDRGQRWSENGEVNTRPLQDADAPVYAADLTPAVNWWFLFSNIISEAGFELVGGSLQNILETYWMPWCNSRFLQGSDTNGGFGFRAENSAPVTITGVTIPFNTEIFDNNGDYNPATYTFTAPVSGRYFFNFNFDVVITGTSARVFVQAIKNGVNNYPIIDVQFFTGTSTWAFNDSQVLNAGDTLVWYAYKQGIGTASFATGSSVGLSVANLNYSQSIYYPLNAPDMKQIDFVTDVIKMHNCAIVADKAVPSKIYIVPQNSYLGSGNVLDWTSKIDISKDITISSTVDLQKAKFQFTYTAGEDILSKQYKQVERVYGDYEAVGYTINPDTTPSDFAIGDQKIQLTTRSTPSGVVNGSGYVMPMFLNEQVQFVAPGPRCLFEAGTWQVQLFKDATSTVLYEAVPVLNNYSAVYAELDDYDLNWSPEVPPHFIYTNPYNNLFNQYWRTYMNALYSPEARMMEASFALSLRDILTFQFSDKIWIQDSYWRIIEINDYKVGNLESTKVKLLKFLEDTEDCTSTPVSTAVNGEVNFEDAGGNPVSATQDCCTRYGYTWDETAGVCWAFIPTGDRPNSPTSGGSTNPSPRVTKATLRNAAVINSVINGDAVTIATANKNMVAVGENLNLTKDVRGNVMLGKNVTTNLPGKHIGGGYRGGDPANFAYNGWAQFGQFVLQRQFTSATSGTTFNLYVEGVPNEYIELEDESVWSVVMNVSITDGIGGNETSLHHFTLDKFAALAGSSAITTIDTISAIGTYVFTFGIDTATNTDEHRINVTVTGGTYPASFVVTANIQYQQVKTSIT